MAWISPDSWADPASVWTNEDNVKDEDTNTYASCAVPGDSWGSSLALFPPTDITIDGTDYMLCNKIRFSAYRASTRINKAKIILNVLEGEGGIEKQWDVYPNNVWVTWDLEGVYRVELAAVTFYNTWGAPYTAKFYEFDFGKAATRGKVNNSLARGILAR